MDTPPRERSKRIHRELMRDGDIRDIRSQEKDRTEEKNNKYTQGNLIMSAQKSQRGDTTPRAVPHEYRFTPKPRDEREDMNHECGLPKRERWPSPFLFLLLMAALFFCFPPLLISEEMLTSPPDDVRINPWEVSSFEPPAGWVERDFFGFPSFSPLDECENTITFRAERNHHPEEISPEEILKAYEHTFCSPNYTAVTIKPKSNGDYPGVEVLSRATEENRLFCGYVIWLVEYYTPSLRVSLTLLCREKDFDTYEAQIKTAFDSLTITPHDEGVEGK
jgi:hypothetical protein